MRIVVRVYRDEATKPHYDEYKTDCEEMRDVLDITEDINAFLQESLVEIQEKEEEE